MQIESRPTPSGAALAGLMEELIALHSALLEACDAQVADLGLSNARLVALAKASRLAAPEPVARLARLMGMSRQNLQRLVNELVIDRLVRLEENPHHRRAPLVVVTSRGRRVLAEAQRRQVPFTNVLARGLSTEEIATAARVTHTLKARLDRAADLFEPSPA